MVGKTLAGKGAIVTGAGRGIGRAIALALAQEGAEVAVWDVDPQGAKRVAEEARALTTRSLASQVDVTRKAQVEAATRAALETFGRIDILVNNAGIYPRSYVWEMPEEEWDRVLEVNLKGVFLCCQAVCPTMMQQRSGKIVAISSGHALRGGAGHAHYSASKAGILGFVKALARELAPYGINVNAIVPTVTDTDMPRQWLSEEELEARARANPMGRIGKPEDIAQAVLFLVGEGSNYITGQTICVNGGDIMH